MKGFPGSSAGKESVYNAGDPGSIPGSGSSPGEGTGYPLQESWAFLVAQMVKNSPAIRKTRVRSLGWEDPLEEGMATHSQYSCLENPHGQRSLAAYVHGVAESATTEQLSTAFIHLNQKHLQRVSSVLGPVRGGLFHVVN